MIISNDEVRHKSAIAPETEAPPVPVFGKKYPTYRLTDMLVQAPTLFLVVSAIVPIILTIVGLSQTTSIDRTASGFTIRKHSSAQNLAAVLSTQSAWTTQVQEETVASFVPGGIFSSLRVGSNVRIGSERSAVADRLYLAYAVDEDKANAVISRIQTSTTMTEEQKQTSIAGVKELMNLFTSSSLGYMQQIESAVQRLDGYSTLCWRSRSRGTPADTAAYSFPSCSPMVSPLTYFYPGSVHNSSTNSWYWDLDGTGALQQPLAQVESLFYTNVNHLWFTDQYATASNPAPKQIRSQITLGKAVPLMTDAEWEDTADTFSEALLSYVEKRLPVSTFIKVYLGGDRLQNAMVKRLLAADTITIFASIIILLGVLVFYFHSIVLALLGSLICLVVYPAGFVIYNGMSGSNRQLSLLTALSYFITLIMSANAQMLFFDTFKQSGYMSTNGRKNMLTIAQRVAYTYRKAGTGITLSMVVAFVAFMLNLASAVPAVVDFCGMVMVFLVVNWYMLMTCFPAAVLFHHFHVSKRRRNLQRQKEIILKRGERQRDGFFLKFATALEELETQCGRFGFADLSIKSQSSIAVRRAEYKRVNQSGWMEKVGVRGTTGGAILSLEGIGRVEGERDATAAAGSPTAASLGESGSGGAGASDPHEQPGDSIESAIEKRRKKLAMAGAAAGAPQKIDEQQFLDQFADMQLGDASAGTNAVFVPQIASPLRSLAPENRLDDDEDEQNAEAEGAYTPREQDAAARPGDQSSDHDAIGERISADDDEDEEDANGEQKPRRARADRRRRVVVPPDVAAPIARGQAATMNITDPMCIDNGSIVHVRHINADEMLAFDDTDLRARLADFGASSLNEFSRAQLMAIAPRMGVAAPVMPYLSAHTTHMQAAEDRIVAVTSLGIQLLYGEGRTLGALPDHVQVPSAKKTRAAATGRVGQAHVKAGATTEGRQPSAWAASEAEAVEMSPSAAVTAVDQGMFVADGIAQSGSPTGAAGRRFSDLAAPQSTAPQVAAAAVVVDGSAFDGARPRTSAEEVEKRKQKELEAAKRAQERIHGGGASTNGPKPQRGARAVMAQLGFGGFMRHWWGSRKGVQRKFCCGLLGQRVEETEADMEERILKKAAKHEGYSVLERAFFNVWAPQLHRWRVVVLVLFVAFLIFGIAASSQVEYAISAPQFLGNNPSEDFDRIVSKFGQSGTCDYCSAFFAPQSTFPVPSPSTIAACSSSALDTPMYFWALDRCGVCSGSDACIDCEGVRDGNATIDSCGQCTLPSDPVRNQCGNCTYGSNISCGFCAQKYDRPYYGGADCAVPCAPSNCMNGKCNPFTGICECYADYTNGFWTTGGLTGIRCDICRSGFYGTQCNKDCSATSQCACSGLSLQCASCPYAYAGPSCNVRMPGTCAATGTATGSSASVGACNCDAGYTGTTCAAQVSCSGHGTTYAAGQVHADIVGTCACFGQWRGASCNICRCYNGGTCDAMGVCTCTPGWGGVDCQECSSTCLSNGACPIPYTINMTTTAQCRALRCTDAELAANKATTASCNTCRALGLIPPCTGYAIAATCNGDTLCEWDAWTPSPRCRAVAAGVAPVASVNYGCSCKGRWIGDQCEMCNTSGVVGSGITCTASTGDLVGCDGRPPIAGVYKVYDSCGTCGGSSTCVGCDGLPYSTKTLDACGICGGDGSSCANGNAAAAATAPVYVVVGDMGSGGSLNIESGAVQVALYQTCQRLLASPLVQASQSACVWADFYTYMRNIGLQLPQEGPYIHQYLYNFAVSQGRQAEVGFSETVPLEITPITIGSNISKSLADDTASFHATWILLQMRGIYTEDAANGKYLNNWDALIAYQQGELTSAATISAASPAFVAVYTKRAAQRGVLWTIIYGMLVFAVLIAAVTCSYELTLLAVVVLGSNVAVAVGFIQFTGEIGPLEQVSLALLLGISSERITHMAESYLEYVHAAQSHLFAREATRLLAAKGMLQRTGVSTVVSSITILIGAIVTRIFADLLVFQRIAVVIIIVILTQLLHCIVFFPAGVIAIGPTVTHRGRKFLPLVVLGCGVAVFALVFGIVYGSGQYTVPVI